MEPHSSFFAPREFTNQSQQFAKYPRTITKHMSALIVPRSTRARRRSVETLPRTPDRPIVNRYRSNSSVSSSTPGSVFDEDIAINSPHSPPTPFSSHSERLHGSHTPSPAHKSYRFVDEIVFTIEGTSTEPWTSSNAFQSLAAHKKDHTTRKSETSLSPLKLPRDSPSDEKSEAPTIGLFSTRESTTTSVTRPRLTRETHIPDNSDEDSAGDSETQTLLEKIRTLPDDDSITFASGEAKNLHSSTTTPKRNQALERSNSENDNSDFTSVKEDKQNTSKSPNLKFSHYGKEKTTHTYNSDICKYILGKRKKTPTPKAVNEPEAKPKLPEPGYVYIFKCPDHAPNHVKIGYTKNDPSSRLKTIERECDIELEIVEQEHQGFFLHYITLETIVHHALHPDRRTYHCDNCKKDDERIHQEWFEISHEKALAKVKLWRDWILDEKPFLDDGTLTDYWYWRAKKLSVSYHKVCWEDWTRSVGIHRLDYVDYMIEMWQEDYWLKLKTHMGRKDIWFCQMGTIFSLLVYVRFGCWGMVLAVVALGML